MRQARLKHGIRPVFKRVDTCAAEFEAQTPYLYSTYEVGFEENVGGGATVENEGRPTKKKKIVILGGGPNRIGQGIEFDYCCVHAVQALREDGYETIMVNCNPETVSTDYDTSDRLYFEPLTREDVLEIVDAEKPEGVIVQFGGQTPLRLAVPLMNAGVKLLGTSADAIDRAEDRQRFGELLKKLDLRAPAWGTAHGLDEAREIAERIGYPVMVRPSYVLGGRAMEIVHDPSGLAQFVLTAMEASRRESLASRAGEEDAPILIDQFLPDAIEVDVDVVADGTDVVVGGVMEHIEEAGIHSGDSACCLPPYSLPPETVEAIKTQARALARELGVRGLMNVQFAVPRDGRGIFILEVNPRASRTVPFVSKVTGVPLAKIAARIAVGTTLKEMGITRGDAQARRGQGGGVPVREVRGRRHHPRPRDALDRRGDGHRRPRFAAAFGKSQIGAGTQAADARARVVPVGAGQRQGRAPSPSPRASSTSASRCVATVGTHDVPDAARGIDVERVNKVREGRPHCVDRILDGDIHLVINTTVGRRGDQGLVPDPPQRAAARGSPTTRRCRRRAPPSARIAELRAGKMSVRSLQEYQRHG